jgi:hypothetical protein
MIHDLPARLHAVAIVSLLPMGYSVYLFSTKCANQCRGCMQRQTRRQERRKRRNPRQAPGSAKRVFPMDGRELDVAGWPKTPAALSMAGTPADNLGATGIAFNFTE